MRQLKLLFAALSESRFRSRFYLGPVDRGYITRKGLPTVIGHARDFVRHRLAPARPMNDGRQTPLRGHPVFVAQHATATCCRSCLCKWHGIRAGTALTDEQVDYAVAVIALWLEEQISRRVSAESFNDRVFSK